MGFTVEFDPPSPYVVPSAPSNDDAEDRINQAVESPRPWVRPSHRISLPAKVPRFPERLRGGGALNGLASTLKPITCRCKTIIQAAFGLWV